MQTAETNMIIIKIAQNRKTKPGEKTVSKRPKKKINKKLVISHFSHKYNYVEKKKIII